MQGVGKFQALCPRASALFKTHSTRADPYSVPDPFINGKSRWSATTASEFTLDVE